MPILPQHLRFACTTYFLLENLHVATFGDKDSIRDLLYSVLSYITYNTYIITYIITYLYNYLYKTLPETMAVYIILFKSITHQYPVL